MGDCGRAVNLARCENPVEIKRNFLKAVIKKFHFLAGNGRQICCTPLRLLLFYLYCHLRWSCVRLLD